MSLKYLLWPTLLLYSCMCTPKADSVRIVGLFMASDSIYQKGSPSGFTFNLVPVQIIKEAPKQHCLTYNKVAPMDTRTNSIIENSCVMICDKKLGMTDPGQPVGNLSLSGDRILFGHLEDQLLDTEVYKISISCKTTDNLDLITNFKLRVH